MGTITVPAMLFIVSSARSSTLQYLYGMRMRLLLLYVLFSVGSIPAYAAIYSYNYSSRCSQAYTAFMSLQMDEGRNAILNENRADPHNLMAVFIADYEDYIVLLLNCDPHEYEERIRHFDERLDVLDNGDPSSPWFRFCKAGIYMHWAVVQLRFGEQYKAALNFRRSFALLKENEQMFPSFEYNKVFSGLQEAVIGSLPGNYKWLAAVFGMKGNMKQGIDKMAGFINTHTDKNPLYAETILYYTYTRFYLLMEQKEVWSFLNSAQFPTGNLLNTFAKVNIGLDYRHSDDVLEALRLARGNTNYEKYPVFDYQAGIALLTKLDTSCIHYFRKYLQNSRSGLFVKDAWQKIAFAYYISGNTAEADRCMEQVRTQGSTRTDADRQAKRFAESNAWPLSKILQARLLIEGGYYQRALTILKAIDPVRLPAISDRIEYTFRMGKAYQELGDNNKAIEYYQKTVAAGRDRSEQYGARAALQMGIIYERAGMKEEAIKRYNQCLDMPAHDFQNSIDQQAKAGISRVRGK